MSLNRDEIKLISQTAAQWSDAQNMYAGLIMVLMHNMCDKMQQQQ